MGLTTRPSPPVVKEAGRPDPAKVGKVGLDRFIQPRRVHSSDQGLITSIPLLSKSSMSLVATDAPRLLAIAAIWQSALVDGTTGSAVSGGYRGVGLGCGTIEGKDTASKVLPEHPFHLVK